jgi:ribosomal RNA-processing protein 8
MQRKMQSKLEGARFRWINEQLYSTASTDAVAMMDTDPKVFADVSCGQRGGPRALRDEHQTV